MHRLPVHIFFSAIILPALLLSSCEDEATPLGKNLIYSKDSIMIMYDHSVFANPYLFSTDSAANFDYGLAGSYLDPLFGFTKVDFVTQLVPLAERKDLDATVKINSLTLTLVVDKANNYGNTSTLQDLYVFLLLKSIEQATSYNNINIYDGYVDTTNLLTANAVPVQVSGTTNTITIALDTAKAKSYLLGASVDDSVFNSNNIVAFRNFFKGFYITTKNNDNGAILRFNLLESTMDLAYNDSLSLRFGINQYCSRINLYYHDYSTAVFANRLNDTSYRDSLSYIQAMAGVQSIIHFGNIQKWKELPLIHKAELIIPIQPDAAYPAPQQLTLITPNNNGKLEVTPDDPYYTHTEYFGGTLKDNSYTFTITRFVYNVLAEKKNYPWFYIFPGTYNTNKSLIYSADIANRVVIKTGQAKNGMKIKITYAKLSNK